MGVADAAQQGVWGQPGWAVRDGNRDGDNPPDCTDLAGAGGGEAGTNPQHAAGQGAGGEPVGCPFWSIGWLLRTWDQQRAAAHAVVPPL